MLRVVGCSVFGCRVPCFTFELIGLFPRADKVKAEAHCNPTAIRIQKTQEKRAANRYHGHYTANTGSVTSARQENTQCKPLNDSRRHLLRR